MSTLLFIIGALLAMVGADMIAGIPGVLLVLGFLIALAALFSELKAGR